MDLRQNYCTLNRAHLKGLGGGGGWGNFPSKKCSFESANNSFKSTFASW